MDAWKVKIFTEFCIYLGIHGHIDLDDKGLLCFYEECLIMAEYLGNISNTAHFNLLLNVGILYKEMNQFPQALELDRKLVLFTIKLGCKKDEAWEMLLAGNVLCSQSKYQEAIEYCEKSLNIALELGDKSVEKNAYFNLRNVYQSLDKYMEVIKRYEKSLNIALELGDKSVEAKAYANLGNVYQSLGKYMEAIKHYEKSLNIALELGDESVEKTAYFNLGNVYQSLGKYMEAIKHYEKSLNIALEIGDKSVEGKAYGNLGIVYQSLGEYMEAIKHYEMSLNIALELGDKSVEGTAYGNLGIVYHSLGKYMVAIKHYEKSLNIALEIGDKRVERAVYGNLGNVYLNLGKYTEAIKHYKKSLNIALELGDKSEKGTAYCNLGNVNVKLGKYMEAIEHYEKSLNIALELGDKSVEAKAYANLGNVYQSLGKYMQAIEHYEKSLNIALELGDKSVEKNAYFNLGNVYQSLGKYIEAIKHYEKSLNIALEIGDKSVEGKAYANLGNVYQSLGKYIEAFEHYEKSLNIALELGDKSLEGTGYANLGNVYQSSGKYMEAIKHYEKSLNIALEIGDKSVEGKNYANLGNVYQSYGMYTEAIKHYEKSLNIALELGDKRVEGTAYGNLGNVYQSLGKYMEAINHYEKILRIALELGDKSVEGAAYGNLGNVYQSLGKYMEAIKHYEKSLNIALESGNKFVEIIVHVNLRNVYKRLGKNKEAMKHHKIGLSIALELWDKSVEGAAYGNLGNETNQTKEALLVCDGGRARALGDILMSKYGLDMKHTLRSTTLEYPDVTKMLSKNNFSILFFAVEDKVLNTWVISSQKPLVFATSKNKENLTLHKVINESFDKMKVREIVRCEDRSLESRSENVKPTQDGDKDVKLEASSVERDKTLAPAEETQRRGEQDRDPLKKLFNILIAPVLQELEQEEIVMIPDGPLYTVPFAALRDPDTGRFLSETKRIRLSPSLSTLKTLQECSTDYHCKKGALIVGDPDVGKVMFKGMEEIFPSLPSAKHEAEIIGANLNVKPLTGSQATKENVKHKLQEGVSIIHIAAHGDSDNGHIALAPTSRTEETSIPEEKDYMLTMQEVQEIGVRAQLVVLSCCHSGRDEIRSEGLVGMSRAFLAAGARAVLASLWAIDDDATLSFMLSFYTYLQQGESASKSLQQAMKELREEGYSEPRHWAPFFLIGDDVSLYKREPVDREKGVESVLSIGKIAYDFNHPALVEMNSPNTGCLSVLIRRDLSILLSESDDNASKIFEHLKTRHAAVLQTSSSEISLERRRFVRENFNKICNEKKHTKITTSEKQEVITYETIDDIQNTFEELGIDISNVQTTNIVELGLKAKEVSEADAVKSYLKRAARKILKSNSQRIHSIIPYHYRGQIAVVIYTYDPTTELVKQNWSSNFLGFTVFIVNLMYSYEIEPPAFPKCYPAIPLEKQESLSKIKDKVTQEFAKKHSNLSSISVDYRIRGNKLDTNEHCLQIGVLTKGIVPLGEECFVVK